MKSAIIGLGVIGKVHYDVLKSQDADIVALCDIDESVLDKFDGVKSIPIIKDAGLRGYRRRAYLHTALFACGHGDLRA